MMHASLPELTQQNIDTQPLWDFYNSALPLVQAFDAIRKRLDELAVWERPIVKTIYRLAAFIEDQNALALRSSDQAYSKENVISSFIIPTADSIADGRKASLMESYEQNCENLELILAYVLYRHSDHFYGDIAGSRSPYGDAQLSTLFNLALSWRRLKDLWSDIKYTHWHPLKLKNGETEILYYVPPDETAFLRSETTGHRKNQIFANRALLSTRPIRSQLAQRYTDTPEAVGKIAHSIKIPAAGKMWDGALDIITLKQALRHPWEAEDAEDLLNKFLYGQVLSEMKLGNEGAVFSWECYWKIITALRLIAEAILRASEKQIKRGKVGMELGRVLLVKKERLARIVSKATGLGISVTQNVIGSLVYSQTQHQLEIWDTPLIQVDEDKVLFVPSLVRHGGPLRNAENFMAQWNRHLFDARGKLLEQDLTTFLQKQRLSLKVKGPVQLNRGKAQQIEFDLAIYWEGYLFLVEAKCSKSVYTPAEMYYAKEDIVEAVQQLNVRLDAVKTHWAHFKAAADVLDLPDECPSADRIILIAVTNIFQFTGWQYQGAVVTDEFCFRRYFGDREMDGVNLLSPTMESLGSLGRIRQSFIPRAREFYTYLANPPQVKLILDNLTLEPLAVGQATANDPAIFAACARFHAENLQKKIREIVRLPEDD